MDSRKNLPVLRVILQNEIYLYIHYNDYGEYSYSIIFSPMINKISYFEQRILNFYELNLHSQEKNLNILQD